MNYGLGKQPLSSASNRLKQRKKPLETALFDLCKREVLGGISTAPKLNLENLAKTS